MNKLLQFVFLISFIPIGVLCLTLSFMVWPIVELFGEDSFIGRMSHNLIWYPAECWEDFCFNSNTRYWITKDDIRN